MHPPFWAHGQPTPEGPNFGGGAILEPPILGPLGVTCPFFQFRTPEHLGTTWTTHTPTDTQPIARKPTHPPWGRPKLNSFFSFPIPHTGGNLRVYTKVTQPMVRESYTSSTLGEPIPHTGVEPDLQRYPYTMKLKNKFSFGPPKIPLYYSHLEESYRPWCVVVCNLETFMNEETLAHGGRPPSWMDQRRPFLLEWYCKRYLPTTKQSHPLYVAQ